MVRPASALYYVPGTPFSLEGDDYRRYINDELNRISAAFKQITDAGLDTPTTIIDGDTPLSGYEKLVLVPGAATVTLPSAAGLIGREINIIRTGTGLVTIATTGAETISGDTFLDLTTQWDSVVMVSDSSNWIRSS